MPESKNSHRMVLAARRENEALDLKLGGKNARQIGEVLGMSPAGARLALVRAVEKLQRQTLDKTEHWRTITNARYERLLESIWTRATNSDDAAVNLALKIIDGQKKIFGIDEPIKQQITGVGGGPVLIQTSEQLDQLDTDELLQLRKTVLRLTAPVVDTPIDEADFEEVDQ